MAAVPFRWIQVCPWFSKGVLMAKIVRKIVGYRGGREGALVALAVCFLVLGFIAALVTIILGLAAGHVVMVLFPAAQYIFIGIVLAVLFDAAAEVIRLLKKLNGLPYGGKISEARPTEEPACSACQMPLYLEGPVRQDMSECPRCGASFEPEIKP
jgi:hypothetical protein